MNDCKYGKGKLGLVSDSFLEFVTLVFVADDAIDYLEGVSTLNLDILLDLTLNDLPPPTDKTAEAPSIIEMSSLITDLYAAYSSLDVAANVNSRLLNKCKIPHWPIFTYASFCVLRLNSIND
jgi:hypothetical protein